MLLTVMLSCLAGLHAVSGRPPAPYIVQPDFVGAVESLPVATESPTEAGGLLSRRRQQERQIMLKSIRTYILASLNMPCTPRAPPYSALSRSERRRLVRLVNSMQNGPGGFDRSGLLKRAQSFYPSCDRPTEQDPSVTRLMPSMDVYFNLTSYFPTVPDDVTIEQATLRVFKISVSERTPWRPGRRQLQTGQDQTVQISLHAYTSSTNDSSQRQATPWSSDVTPWSSDVTPWSGDRDGPRPVDQLTVAASQRGWLTFDVRSAVRAWKLGAHNLGFLLTVEDLAGRQLSPDSFFQDMECDLAVPSSPVPGLLVQVARDADLDMQSEPRYPVLDLLTSEPAADSVMPGPAIPVTDEPCPPPAGGQPALARRLVAVPTGPLRRRHRHGRHRRTADRRWRHQRQR